jgi:hypothetical protein
MLSFNIDWRSLREIGDKLEASNRQIGASLSRALRRTEATLRRMSSQGLTKELELRAAGSLRKRLKSIKLGTSGKGKSVGLWYGLNDLPVSAFKGRPQQDRRGAWFKDFYFEGAFVAKSNVKGKQTIFKRVREAPLPITEQLILIQDRAIVYIEDEIFDKVEDIFWLHFMRDLKARVKYNIESKY